MGDLKVSYITPPGSDQRYAMIAEGDFIAIKDIISRLDVTLLEANSEALKELAEALDIRARIASGEEETFPKILYRLWWLAKIRYASFGSGAG